MPCVFCYFAWSSPLQLGSYYPPFTWICPIGLAWGSTDFSPVFASFYSTSFLLTPLIAPFAEARSSGGRVPSATGMRDVHSGATGSELPGIFSSRTPSTVPTAEKERIVWSSRDPRQRALPQDPEDPLRASMVTALPSGGAFTSPRQSPALIQSRRQT